MPKGAKQNGLRQRAPLDRAHDEHTACNWANGDEDVRTLTLPLLATALLVGASSAHAQMQQQRPIMGPNHFRAVLPPVEFDRPYRGKLTIRIMRDDAAMLAACRSLTE